MQPEQYRETLHAASETIGLPACTLRPAPTADLLAVERTLGFTLPQEYVAFLLEVGCGEEFGGLAVWFHFDLAMDGNVVEVAADLARQAPRAPRTQPHRKLPRGFLPVYDARDGNVYGFIPRSSNEYEPNVYAWDTDNGELRRVADSLSEFLDYLADGLDVGGAPSDDVIF